MQKMPINPPAVSWSRFAQTLATLRRTAAAAAIGNPRLSGVMASPPTVTAGGTTQPSGQTNGYTYTGHTASFRFFGGRVKTYATNFARLPSATRGDAGGNASDGEDASGGRVEFVTDAIKVGIRVVGSTTPYRFLVDDRYVSTAGTTTTNSSGAEYINLDFTSAGGRAVRKVAVEMELAQAFYGAYVTPTETIHRSPALDLLRMIAIGESHVSGTGATRQRDGYVAQLGDWLGIRDVWMSGIGGSGYVQPGTGSINNMAQRLAADVDTRSPDIVLFAGGANDTSGATLRTAILTCLRQTRAALPNALIILLGPIPENDSATAGRIANEADLLTSFQSFGDPRSLWVPTIGSTPGAWTIGTGRVGATTGSGNADIYVSSDGTHMSDAGHAYVGRRAAAEILTALGTLAA